MTDRPALTLGDRYQAAMALAQSGNLDQAEAAYRSMIAASPNFSPAWQGLALIALAQANTSWACRLLRLALALNPDIDDYWFNLGAAYRAGQIFDPAIGAFDRVLALAPDTTAALNNRNLLRLERLWASISSTFPPRTNILESDQAAVAIPRLLTPAQCHDLISWASGAPADAGRLGIGTLRPAGEVRRSQVRWLDLTPATEAVFAAVMAAFAKVNRDHFGFDLSGVERLQFAEYDAEVAGHYDWHIDHDPGSALIHRRLTIAVQLSDPADYDGGRLEWRTATASGTGSIDQGGALVFPATMSHRVTPVTRGRRRSLVCWANGRA